MVNIDLLWYFCLPLVLAAVTIFVQHRIIPDITWLQSTGAALIGLAIGALILTGTFYAGKGAKTADTQVVNGEVLSKARTQGTYDEPYDCHCRTVTSGSGKNKTTTRKCETCYRDHYTVNWDCTSNIGEFSIKSEDWTSSAVYALPDPKRFEIITRGDPVSRTENYVNYIKAVPDTLIRPDAASLKEQFKAQIPEYPLEIYDHYHIDRVIPVGISVPNLAEWNAKLSDALKLLGPHKQANAVIVLTKSADTNYFYALQDAWINGKKNDIVLVIGAPNFPRKAAWARVMALTQDQIFQVKLRDDILALDTLTADAVISTLSHETLSTFKRKPMRDFKYLENEIDPPTWLMQLCAAAIVLSYIIFWIYLYRNQHAGAFGRFGHPRLRRSFR